MDSTHRAIVYVVVRNCGTNCLESTNGAHEIARRICYAVCKEGFVEMRVGLDERRCNDMTSQRNY
jgi:hypothetical protein